MEQQATYYQSLPDNKRAALESEEARNDRLYKGLLQLEQQFKNPQPPVQETPGGSTIKTQSPDSNR